MRMYVVYSILPTGLLFGCSDGGAEKSASAPTAIVLPVFDAAHLKQGKTTWNANCKVCHIAGLAAAPKITDKAVWRLRIARGKSVLYEHALNGFMGASGTAMLTDNQVKAAVDYMVAASQ